ncbi:hypothetical protein SH668x_000072 [Planctomicrobium sp. SH668]|uniref:hypothetical protein n=1 Tax=Planctomicrobium sp. SH668 TaxID=3448126 RepID=UPI003F5BF0B6
MPFTPIVTYFTNWLKLFRVLKEISAPLPAPDRSNEISAAGNVGLYAVFLTAIEATAAGPPIKISFAAFEGAWTCKSPCGDAVPIPTRPMLE